jgi:Zn finger protein HypA/HybF involved in hydrogenase expression
MKGISVLRKYLADWEKRRQEKRFEFKCEKCGEIVNAKTQSGLCPHIPIEEFIFRGKKPVAVEDK